MGEDRKFNPEQVNIKGVPDEIRRTLNKIGSLCELPARIYQVAKGGDIRWLGENELEIEIQKDRIFLYPSPATNYDMITQMVIPNAATNVNAVQLAEFVTIHFDLSGHQYGLAIPNYKPSSER